MKTHANGKRYSGQRPKPKDEAPDFLEGVQRATGDKRVRAMARIANRDLRTRSGRASKLTEARAAKILQLVLDGNYPRIACQAVGIHKSTLDAWKVRAAEWLDQGEVDINEVPEEERMYVAFVLMLRMAEAQAEIKLLRTAAEGRYGWQAAMTVLERRWPAYWGRSEKRIYEGGDPAKPIMFEVAPASERRKHVAEILDEAGALKERE